MKITRHRFGRLADGRHVDLYILKCGEMTMAVSDFGATLVGLEVPSRRGPAEDVLLGFSTLDGYAKPHPYFGSSVGRFANRIAGATFSGNGKTYRLAANDGPNCLHGGRRGLDHRLWRAEAARSRGGVAVRLRYSSPDGEEGFPGRAEICATYRLSTDGELTIDYRAKVDAPCPINLTNHAYFNLAGEGVGTILDHEMRIAAERYLPVRPDLIPLEAAPVAGTPFDFRVSKPIGRELAAAGGYDHCFLVDGKVGELRPAAEAFDPGSGRSLKVSTTQPGIQFYSGNFLAGEAGKLGSRYPKHGGFCLETQGLPDSPNRPADAAGAWYGPDREYRESSVFAFAW
jgi:aldose 1-epimerase